MESQFKEFQASRFNSIDLKKVMNKTIRQGKSIMIIWHPRSNVSVAGLFILFSFHGQVPSLLYCVTPVIAPNFLESRLFMSNTLAVSKISSCKCHLVILILLNRCIQACDNTPPPPLQKKINKK